MTHALHASAATQQSTLDSFKIAPNAQVFELSNGMKAVVIPDVRTPVVTHMVWYRVGAADEPRGKSGIAHFLEHLMFKGTAKFPEGVFSDKLASIGGQENAFTGHDYTAYFQRAPKEQLEILMDFESDRMRGIILTDANVNPEREVVREERRLRVDRNPEERMDEALNAIMYFNHPYRTPIIGWDHEIQGLTRQDALDFYNQVYSPNNAVLVVVGDVDVPQVKALAEKYYGVVPKRAEKLTRTRPSEPTPYSPRRLTVADSRVEQPHIEKRYLVPSYRTGKAGEAEAIEVLSEWLGGGATSQLYQRLVVKEKVASSISVYYDSMSYDDSAFMLSMVPNEGVSLEQLEVAYELALKEALAQVPEEKTIARLKNAILSEMVFSQDSPFSLARIFGAAMALDFGIEEIQTSALRLRGVQPKDVQAVGQTYLTPQRSVTGYLIKDTSGKAVVDEPAGASAGKGRVHAPLR